MTTTLLPPLWKNDVKSVHLLQPETETYPEIGHAKHAETALTNITSDTHGTTTANGIPPPVHTTNTGPSTVKAARQVTIDNMEITLSDSTTACTAGPETAEPTKDEADIHETPADLVIRTALNSCDWTRHLQNNALV